MDGGGEGRRVRSEETWTAAREAYLAGLSAGEVCARFDLGQSALRARARREGWRRTDQADPDPALEPDLDDELDELGPADFEFMADRAARLALRALLSGDVNGAERWTRVHLKLRPAADEQASRREWEKDQAARRAARQAERDTALQGQGEAPTPASAPSRDVHSVHSVHGVSECTPPDPAQRLPPSAAKRLLNREDRRKQARVAALRARATARAGAGQGP